MVYVAELLSRAATDDALDAVRHDVHELVGSFPTVFYCFEHSYPQ